MSKSTDEERRREARSRRISRAEAILSELQSILALARQNLPHVAIAQRTGLPRRTLYRRLRALLLTDQDYHRRRSGVDDGTTDDSP